MQERHNAIRDALAETLGMLAHKARTGQMTDDDVAVIYRAIHDAGGIRAALPFLCSTPNEGSNARWT